MMAEGGSQDVDILTGLQLWRGGVRSGRPLASCPGGGVGEVGGVEEVGGGSRPCSRACFSHLVGMTLGQTLPSLGPSFQASAFHYQRMEELPWDLGKSRLLTCCVALGESLLVGLCAFS